MSSLSYVVNDVSEFKQFNYLGMKMKPGIVTLIFERAKPKHFKQITMNGGKPFWIETRRGFK